MNAWLYHVKYCTIDSCTTTQTRGIVYRLHSTQFFSYIVSNFRTTCLHNFYFTTNSHTTNRSDSKENFSLAIQSVHGVLESREHNQRKLINLDRKFLWLLR